MQRARDSWPFVELEKLLAERKEKPKLDDILEGKTPIVAKISFETGKLEFRGDSETKTEMILAMPGDLVISGINAAKGAIAIYGKENDKPVAATIHYSSYKIDKERVFPAYLWHFMRSKPFRSLLVASLPKGIKTEVKPTRLLPIKVPLPPIDEQRRIVERIEHFSTMIETAKQMKSNAVEDGETLNLQILKGIRTRLLSKDYDIEKIGDIVTVTSGGTPSRKNPRYWGGNIPWIKSGELNDGEIVEAEEYITQEGLADSSAKLFPVNTILVALYGQGQTRGRTGRLMMKAATNQACAAILPKPHQLEPRFVQYWIRSMYLEMRENYRDGAQPNWNGRMIKNIEIAIPPKAIQRQVVAYLDIVQKKLDELKKLQLETKLELEAIFPAIMNGIF